MDSLSRVSQIIKFILMRGSFTLACQVERFILFMSRFHSKALERGAKTSKVTG